MAVNKDFAKLKGKNLTRIKSCNPSQDFQQFSEVLQEQMRTKIREVFPQNFFPDEKLYLPKTFYQVEIKAEEQTTFEK